MKIVGILDFSKGNDRLWGNFREAFLAHYPEAEFVVEHCLYLPWHKSRIQSFSIKILEKYDTGEDILMFGYSLGGIFACSLVPQFKRSHIKAVITFGTPHKLKFFYSWLSVTPVSLSIPVYTFAGVYDFVVPWFLTRYPGSLHTWLFSDHLIMPISSLKPAMQIVERAAFLLEARACNRRS